MSASASVLLNRLLAKARFRHLQVMVRLAELGSLQRTASSVGMTQPAITHLLSDLEALLEVQLFQRHARGVRPSAACLELLPMARQVLGGLNAGAEAVASRQRMGEGTVRVVASGAAINALLTPGIVEFNRRHPRIQVHVREAEFEAGQALIVAGEVDLVCCREPPVVPQGWEFAALQDDAFVVIAGPAHPLARRRRLRWEDLARETWLPAPVGTAARTRFDQIASSFPSPPPTCEVVTRVPVVTAALLRAQRLLTLVPASSLRHLIDAGQVVVLPLDAPQRDPLAFGPLGVLLPAGEVPPATRKLADTLAHIAQAAQ